jgi:predicted DNA-binding antitoxin AbrB/MazE fold protein
MGIIIHARIKDGIIYPLEKINIEDKEVLVKILKEDNPPFKTKIESSNEMVKQILEEELDLLL